MFVCFFHPEVVTTIQCGGNRRSELDQIEKTSGIPWGFGAMSTAKFGGVYLREAGAVFFSSLSCLAAICYLVIIPITMNYLIFIVNI